jgi:hypothetical protein
MNLIIGKTGAPHANDRSSMLPANAGIPRTESRVDALKNERLRGISMCRLGWGWLHTAWFPAAGCSER